MSYIKISLFISTIVSLSMLGIIITAPESKDYKQEISKPKQMTCLCGSGCSCVGDLCASGYNDGDCQNGEGYPIRNCPCYNQK